MVKESNMARNYYCVVAGLPNISLEDTKLSYTSIDFKSDLKEFLHKDDFKMIEDVFLEIDNKNILNFLDRKTEDFIKGGKYDQEMIEEETKEPVNFMNYLNSFITSFNNEEVTEDPEKYLTDLYYNYLIKSKNMFFRNWYDMNLNIKNIFTALKCKKYDIELEKHIIGDTETSRQILKSHAADFGLTGDIEYIDEVLRIASNENTLEAEKGVDLFLWNKLEEMTFFNYFTIEKIVAYLFKLRIIERWLKLDEQTGREMFRRFVKELEQSYELPKEFVI